MESNCAYGRIDELGRVHIPRYLRKKAGLKECDVVEIKVDTIECRVSIKKVIEGELK